jgi:protein-S-isoprenylcysteine O-methyltransferase Ste14
MSSESNGYGLWLLAVINASIFIAFAFSFTRPRTTRDWRSLGAFAAFVIALFTEMYGFPLTIFLLSGWLKSSYPGIDVLSHNTGHLWETLFGWRGDPHLNPLHLVSDALIAGGLILLGSAWSVLYQARRSRQLATTGPYARVRHPQYLGFVLIMTGFLVQWPTLLTLAMFPVLVFMYVKLARQEEREAIAEFGEPYLRYAAATPRFIPRLRRQTQGPSEAGTDLDVRKRAS